MLKLYCVTLILYVNELETIWSFYHDAVSGISYYTVEVGATLWPFGNSVVNFVGLMLRGLFGGLKFGVGIMLST